MYGIQNCTYNTHVIGGHVIDIRTHGPLTFSSAFAFESFYGEERQSFVPGTSSPLKQVLQKVLLKRILEKHCCEPSITYSTYETALENNSLVYTFVDREYHFFKIVNIEDSNLHCVEINKRNKSFPETPTINWSKLGVFEEVVQEEDIDAVTVVIPEHVIAGKVIRVKNLLLSFAKNVLLEQ